MKSFRRRKKTNNAPRGNAKKNVVRTAGRHKNAHLKGRHRGGASPPMCRVTLRVPKGAFPDAEEMSVVGEFNKWDVAMTPMKQLKSGDFSVTMELPCNIECSFRYFPNPSRLAKNQCPAEKIVSDSYMHEED